MRIERGATNGLLMAARPTLSPSYWLLRFVKAEDETVYQLCIADAVKVSIGNPVMVEFAEVASGADPQSAEVTLSPGQWLLYAYEQSTTSLNWTLASRLAYEQLVEVVGAAAPDPDPTDPCGDSDPCDVIADAEASEIVSCTPDANKPALYGALTADDAITPEVIVTALDGADKTDEVKAIICDECPPCDDASWELRNENDKLIESGTIPSGGSDTIIAPSATYQRVDSAANPIGAPGTIASGATDNILCPDGTFSLNGNDIAVKSNGGEFVDVLNSANAEVGSLESAHIWRVGDSTITKPDGTTAGLAATAALDVRDYRSGIAYNLGRILHSGQTTLYRTGDEGSMYAAGFFSYTRPVYPLRYAELGANFTTLVGNNVWGNTLRFTDRTGSAAASSGNRFIQDHLTGIEYYVLGTYLSGNWDTAIDAGVAINATLGETGWYLPNDRVLDSITNDDSGAFISGAPFSGPATLGIWSSSTVPGNTASAKFLSTVGNLTGNTKSSSTYYYGIYCRRFA